MARKKATPQSPAGTLTMLQPQGPLLKIQGQTLCPLCRRKTPHVVEVIAVAINQTDYRCNYCNYEFAENNRAENHRA